MRIALRQRQGHVLHRRRALESESVHDAMRRRRLRVPRRGAEAGAVRASSTRWKPCAPTCSAPKTCPNARHRLRVKRVVVLSTDKAVYPDQRDGHPPRPWRKSSMVAHSAHDRRIRGRSCCATRYGNVMASRGSVIPLFVEPAARRPAADRDRPEDDPLPDVARGFGRPGAAMPFNTAQQGDIFIQKAPASTVGDLAQALQRAFRPEQRGERSSAPATAKSCTSR